ncbi:MAG: alkaline phosphatase family protein [Alistipes sp.]
MCVATATAQPKLAVNIVVSGMRASDIDRYGANFGQGGFRRLTDKGAVFTECYADYAPTSTHAGAATLASGTLPSVHGIVSRIWYDRTTNKPIELCKAAGNNAAMPYTGITDAYSGDCIVSQTLAEAVAAYSPTSRSITIAHTPQSAILTAGRSGECYWLDERGNWSSAKCYTEALPSWVRSYNEDAYNNIFAGYQWYGKYTKERYRNSRTTAVALYDNDSKAKRPTTKPTASRNAVANILATPAGSPAIFEFAKRAVSALCPLKADERKVLNIYIDTSRTIVETFGPDSAEYEDMLYCLDDTLADFLTFLYAQTDNTANIVVTLASDHGTSRTIGKTTDAAQPDERFNARQFEVIVNAFLSARHGQDEWVLGYCDNALYLNRDVIYKHRKTVADIQTETASFALQFRGIAYAVSATAMQNNYFGNDIAHLMQNGFYPRRSGDVMVCLLPERIEEVEDKVSCSGSPYNYDRHVPLIIYGGGIAPQRIDKRTGTASIAPTVARLLGAERPDTSTAETITDLKTE